MQKTVISEYNGKKSTLLVITIENFAKLNVLH